MKRKSKAKIGTKILYAFLGLGIIAALIGSGIAISRGINNKISTTNTTSQITGGNQNSQNNENTNNDSGSSTSGGNSSEGNQSSEGNDSSQQGGNSGTDQDLCPQSGGIYSAKPFAPVGCGHPPAEATLPKINNTGPSSRPDAKNRHHPLEGSPPIGPPAGISLHHRAGTPRPRCCRPPRSPYRQRSPPVPVPANYAPPPR